MEEDALPPFRSAGDPSSPVKASARAIPMLDLQRQHQEVGAEILEAVAKVLSAQKFVLGPEVSEFEAAAAAHCGAGYGIGCASGSDAIWLALTAANIGPGNAVVTTPFSFFSTASSILRAGAEPVFADIDPVTFNLSAAAVETAMQRGSGSPRAGLKVKAVLPVHLYGQPVAWNEFEDLRNRYGIFLLEDAAQAFGARWDDRAAGSLGDAAAFSFYPTKNLSAAGDAGLITTSDPTLAEHAAMLRTHGMRRRYYHDELGWNSRLDTLQAAILLVKLRYVERWNAERRKVADTYRKLFTEAGIARAGTTYPEDGLVLPETHRRATHVWHQYVIRVARRDRLKQFLADREIATESYYPLPLHLQRALRHLGHAEGDFPESERAAGEVLALPMYPELSDRDQETIVAAVADFLS